MDTFLKIIALFTAVIFLNACKDTYKVIESKSSNEVVNQDLSTTDSLYSILSPYKSNLEGRMNEVLAVSDVSLEIGNPEGLLGDFVADLVLSTSNKISKEPIDVCILNNGGLRVSLEKGDITRGMIYELMPFENQLVVLSMKGDAMVDMINHIVEKSSAGHSVKSGVPISGMRIQVVNGSVSGVMIGVKSFDKNKTYRIVTSDYLAGGGDSMSFFAESESITALGVKLRDVIMEYVSNLGKKDIHINAQIDGRIYVKE